MSEYMKQSEETEPSTQQQYNVCDDLVQDTTQILVPPTVLSKQEKYINIALSGRKILKHWYKKAKSIIDKVTINNDQIRQHNDKIQELAELANTDLQTVTVPVNPYEHDIQQSQEHIYKWQDPTTEEEWQQKFDQLKILIPMVVFLKIQDNGFNQMDIRM